MIAAPQRTHTATLCRSSPLLQPSYLSPCLLSPLSRRRSALSSRSHRLRRLQSICVCSAFPRKETRYQGAVEMASGFEIIGFIASVLQLAIFVRDLMSRVCDLCTDSFWETSGCSAFVKSLILLEQILKRYMNLLRGENSLMRVTVEAVRCDLDKAWRLVSDFLDKRGWLWPWRAYTFPKKLKQLEQKIWRNLITILTEAGNPVIEDGHESGGNEGLDLAVALSLSQKEQRKANSRGGRAIQVSLDIGSSPRSIQSPIYPSTYGYPTRHRICAGCNNEIRYGRFLNRMGAVRHPQYSYCHACGKPISEHMIPTNRAGLIEYRAHPFWEQMYCPLHGHDHTLRCSSCESMEVTPFFWATNLSTSRGGGLPSIASTSGSSASREQQITVPTPPTFSHKRGKGNQGTPSTQATTRSTSRGRGPPPIAPTRAQQMVLSTLPTSTPISRGKGKAVAFSHKKGQGNQGTPSAQATTRSTSRGRGPPPIAPTSRAQQMALSTLPTSTPISRGKGKAVAFSHKKGKGNQGTPSAQATTPSTSRGHGLSPIAPTSRAQQMAPPTPPASASTSTRVKGNAGKGKGVAFSPKRSKGNQ